MTVAVIDTGVNPHPDLKRNLLVGADFTSSGADGRRDSDGHGTAMAGIIAAHGQIERRGALGISPKSKVVPIRVRLDSDHQSNDSLAKGIQWATEQGATVICISAASSPSPSLQRAVEMAVRHDAVVVAGTGNRPTAFGVGFPASYSGVLAIGSTDINGKIAEFSARGPRVDLTAPGVDIYSTGIGGQYRLSDGTSNSTAIVAGAAALVRSRYPELSAAEVAHRLTATAIDKGPPGRDDEYGYGVLNVVAALTADVPPLEPSTSPAATTATAAPQATGPSDDGRAGWLVVVIVAALTGIGGLAWWWRRERDEPPVRRSWSNR